MFVAVWPPPSVVAAIAALPRPDTDAVRWVAPERSHVTLRFLGACDPGAVLAALAGVGGDLGGVTPTAVVGPAVSRLGRNGLVLCVPVAGLDVLAAAVLARTAHLGHPPEHRRFAGHITVGRLRQGRSCGLAGHRIDATFPVGELVVVTSTPAAGAGPAEWRTEGVVSLAGRDPQVSPSRTSDAEFMQ